MKTIPYNALILLLAMLPVLGQANNGQPFGKYTKEKTIKKEFDVNADALLKVTNSYGNLTLSSWNQNRVVIEVHIKTNGNNEEKVKEKLDEITVEFEANPGMVSARTIFDKNRGGWNWNWGRKSNVNMQINYTIRLPIKNNVQLSNDYGNITLDRIDGHARISCDYGRLDLGELRGRHNQLNFDYTSKSQIGFINSGTIAADYSGFSIAKAGDLEIQADYTNSTIGAMGNLKYSSDYGKLEVGEARNVEGNGDYINVELGTVHGNVDIRADYGSVSIGKMSREAGNINIRTDYTGIKIGYDPAYHFDFEITAEYAGVSGKEDLEIAISKENSTDRYYKGHYGSAGSGNRVYVNSTYGNISFNNK